MDFTYSAAHAPHAPAQVSYSAAQLYLGASPTAAGPQTGMGLPNWLRRRKFRSSEIPVFRIFDNRRNTNFLRAFLKNPLVGSVAGDHTQLSPTDFLLSFTRARFLPGITTCLADVMCRFGTRSRMFAFAWLAVAWEWLEITLGVLGLSFDGVIS